MSLGQVRAAIEQMEAWTADPAWEPDPEALAQWNAGFQAALAQVDKTKDWSELAARAHAAGERLQAHLTRVGKLRDGVKAELDAIDTGNRALKGYGANTR